MSNKKYNIIGKAMLAVFIIALLAMLLIVIFIIVLINVSPADNELWDALEILNTFVFFCQVIVIVAATIVGRKYNKVMQSILNGMEDITNGNFDVNINIKSGNSGLKDIGNYLNIMANQLKSTEILNNDFIESFSHEMKTPIVSLQGFAKRLLTKEFPEEKQREYLNIIYEESCRLASLSSNILAMAKLDSQQIVAEKTLFFVDDQIRQSILLLESQWNAKNITLDLNLDRIQYFSNPEHIKQIAVNLLNNAIKFSAADSKISISAFKCDSKLIISIADNGIGMDETTKSKATEKYFQFDKSHSSAGTGLGLPIVKRIVELLGGQLAIESELGKGSAFTVTLC